MRNLILRISLFILMISFTLPGRSMITPSSAPPSVPVEFIYKKILSMNVKEVQHQIGRKLTLKEKLGFWVLKEKARHELKKASKGKKEKSSQGSTALIIAALALAFLVTGFFVPAFWLASIVMSIIAIVMGTSAYKINPKDMKAHSAKLIGWIVLGLIALLALLAVIIVSSWWE